MCGRRRLADELHTDNRRLLTLRRRRLLHKDNGRETGVYHSFRRVVRSELTKCFNSNGTLFLKKKERKLFPKKIVVDVFSFTLDTIRTRLHSQRTPETRGRTRTGGKENAKTLLILHPGVVPVHLFYPELFSGWIIFGASPRASSCLAWRTVIYHRRCRIIVIIIRLCRVECRSYFSVIRDDRRPTCKNNECAVVAVVGIYIPDRDSGWRRGDKGARGGDIAQWRGHVVTRCFTWTRDVRFRRAF